MDELFALDNGSLVLRLIQYLTQQTAVRLEFVSVIYQHDYWVVRIKNKPFCSRAQEKNMEAVLWELGEPLFPDTNLYQVLTELQIGRSPVAIMQDYTLSIVSHGQPNELEVELFRRNVSSKLGFHP